MLFPEIPLNFNDGKLNNKIKKKSRSNKELGKMFQCKYCPSITSLQRKSTNQKYIV